MIVSGLTIAAGDGACAGCGEKVTTIGICGACGTDADPRQGVEVLPIYEELLPPIDTVTDDSFSRN